MTIREKLKHTYTFLAILLTLINITIIVDAQGSENTGRIYGQVALINEPLPNQNVSLSKLQILLENATTDTYGNYAFENLALDEIYEVSLVFQGVPYSKEVHLNQTSVQVDFTVYETTTSDADMKILWIDVIIIFEEGHLRIYEQPLYNNAGLQVFNNSRLKAWLPSGISGFKTSVMDCCVQQSGGNVFFDPMDPIMPNSNYSMWMEYNISISSSQQQFEKKLAYDTKQFYLIIENKSGVSVEVTDAIANSPRSVEVGNVKYTVYNGVDLKANSTIIVKFTGLPTPPNYGPLFLWVMIPLIVGISFLTYPIVRKRSNEKKTSPDDLEAQKLMQFEEIAKLDSKYAEGKISKEKYEKLKSRHKKKVVNLIQQIEKRKATQIMPPESHTPILTELHAEEQALIATLHKLDLDYKKGLVSAESYEKMKTRFEHRRAEVVGEIKKIGKKERSQR